MTMKVDSMPPLQAGFQPIGLALFESFDANTGGYKTGPIATFESVYKGFTYFHVRRVTVDQVTGGMYQTGQGLNCQVENKAAMLAVLAKVLRANGYLVTVATEKLATKGKVKAKPELQPA